MVRKKQVRMKGKIPLSRQFQDLKGGDSVAVIKELSVPSNFPERLQGRTGVVLGRRGKEYLVKVKDNNKEKRFIIGSIHLKKIKN